MRSFRVLLASLLLLRLVENELRICADEMPGSNRKNNDTSRIAVLSWSNNSLDIWRAVSNEFSDRNCRGKISSAAVEVEPTDGSKFFCFTKGLHHGVVVTRPKFP